MGENVKPPQDEEPWGICAACNAGAHGTADTLGRKSSCDCCRHDHQPVEKGLQDV